MENAPTAGTGMGQTGILKNDKPENDGTHEQCKLLSIMFICQSKMFVVLHVPSSMWQFLPIYL